MDEQYANLKAHMKTFFDDIPYFSATGDIWSDNKKGFMEVTAHWIDPVSRKRRSCVLACSRVTGSHKYDVIAPALMQPLCEFDIAHKTVSITTDNASNFVKAFNMFHDCKEFEELDHELTKGVFTLPILMLII